ncbi:MAG: DUF1292 domain-containing protein [Firmicutes bacterium]|nr:DUF1292 domain-containing protein [Bacillota bacterium]
MTEERDNVLELIDEEGNQHDFAVLDILEVEGASYAVLQPLNDPEFADSDDAVIMRIDTDENGEEILNDIDDDEEWEKVVDYYNENVVEYDD